jgi:vacuolar-type H+-ATPase subunit I/STV1
MSTSSPRALPWSPIDALVLWLLLLVGAVLLFLGWWGTSSTARLGHQVVWLNLGALGLLVAGLGVAVWLAAGRRAVGRRRRLLLADVPVAVEGTGVEGFTAELVAGPSMTRYHRADCEFVAGKPVTRAPEAIHHRAGRRPCAVCLPEVIGGA